MKFWKKSRVKRVRPVKLPRPEDVFPQPNKPARPVQVRSPEEVFRQADKPASPVKVDENLSKLTPEARAKLEADEKKIKEIVAFADENPEDASTVLRAWLVQKDGK